jgi:adenylylsulfate reductase subunit B
VGLRPRRLGHTRAGDLDSELLALEDKPEYLGFKELPRPKQPVRIVGSIIKAKGAAGR